MKEKTYYEVLEEIERLNRKQARMVRETNITLNGKNYQITIEETKYGIDKL